MSTSTTATVPLTTVFTPPASCATEWTYEADSYNLLPYTLLLQNAVDQIDSDCYPPKFSANGRAWALQVYSPGWCPHGYTSASFIGFRGTTTAVCCQNNFYYTTSISPQADGNTLFFTGCISSYDSSTSVLSRSGSVATASASVGPGTLWGQPITVMNQQSDLSLFSTSPSTTSTSSASASQTPSRIAPSTSGTSGTASTGPPSPSESSNSTTTTSASSGLSTGADVGIGVGVGVGVLLLLAFVGLMLWRKRRSKGRTPGRPELDGRQLPPMSNPVPPQELDAHRPRQELEGSYAPQKQNQPTSNMSAYNQARTKRWRPWSWSTSPPSELPA